MAPDRVRRRSNVSALEDHIGYWLRAVSNGVSHAFARKLDAKGVSVTEWVVLREMYGGDQTTSPSRVAELTGLTRGAISKLVEKLLQKGLVSRAAASDDRRYQDIRLTRQGIALVPVLASSADDNDEEYFSALSKREREELVLLLKKIATAKQLLKAPLD